MNCDRWSTPTPRSCTREEEMVSSHLHEAKTVAIADFLLDRGADVNVRCIDHKSTPAQYALVDRPDVCRRLLERGATPDIFMAARLGDVALATRLLDDDPSCIGARIHEHGYAPVPPCTSIAGRSGSDSRRATSRSRFGHREVHDLLASRSPARIQFLDALSSANEQAARAVLLRNRRSCPIWRARITAVWPSRSSSSASTLPTSCSVWASIQPHPVSTAARHSMPRAGWATCGWSKECSRAAPCRSTPGIRRTRAHRSDGPRSDPCIVVRAAQITPQWRSGSWRQAPTSAPSATGRVERFCKWRRAILRCRRLCGGWEQRNSTCGPKGRRSDGARVQSDGARVRSDGARVESAPLSLPSTKVSLKTGYRADARLASESSADRSTSSM